MAPANPNYSDILATTIENRSKKLADNVTNNNAVLKKLSMKENGLQTFSGGTKILQELQYAENSNAGWYSGYDILPVGVTEIISAAEYPIKQAAVPVIISGLEQLQNASKEQMINLMRGRLMNAESSLKNLIAEGLYSNGSGAGNKQIDGLQKAISLTPAVGSYGNIAGGTFTFWQNGVQNPGTPATSANINEEWNALWAQLVRGNDRPDLIMCDNTVWQIYVASLQQYQRFATPETAGFGFPTLKFMDADVCLDGGIYKHGRTGAPAGTAYFLNTNYLHYRPHADRNMVPLSPNKRYATNQDAEVQIIGWAGNLTCSGRMFQGIFDNN